MVLSCDRSTVELELLSFADESRFLVGSLTIGDDPNNRSTIRPDLVRMSEIEPREIVWLWENRFPAGQISLIVGTPGFGKSFVTCDMAARISVGAAWPDGTPCN